MKGIFSVDEPVTKSANSHSENDTQRKNVKCVTKVDTMKRVHTSIPILPECWPLWITLARTLLRGKRMGRDGDSARSTEIYFTV